MDIANQTQIVTDFDKLDGTTNTLGDASYPLGMLEGTTCFGDSGGPLFSVALGGNALIGVLHAGGNSFGGDCEYGDLSFWTPINNADNINFLISQGLTPVPEPDTVLLTVAGLGMMLLGRRLKRQTPPVRTSGSTGSQ